MVTGNSDRCVSDSGVIIDYTNTGLNQTLPLNWTVIIAGPCGTGAMVIYTKKRFELRSDMVVGWKERQIVAELRAMATGQHRKHWRSGVCVERD